MRFNEQDTQILLFLLSQIKVTPHNQPNIQALKDKLNQNEYIKGRILFFMYTEIVKLNYSFKEDKKVQVEQLLKSIKFKATPR